MIPPDMYLIGETDLQPQSHENDLGDECPAQKGNEIRSHRAPRPPLHYHTTRLSCSYCYQSSMHHIFDKIPLQG